jgi:hypothetical protein
VIYAPPRRKRDDIITSALLSGALLRSAAGEEPTLQWRLLSRAQRLYDHRQAIVEAASAAEIALAESVHRRLGSTTSERARERIIKNANGIVGLVELLHELDGDTTKSRRNAVADRVAGPRNLAAHRGIAPDLPTLHAALAEVRQLLTKYTPAPSPPG